MTRVRDDFSGVVYVRVNGLVKALRAGDEIPSEAPVGGHIRDFGTGDDAGEVTPNEPENAVDPEQTVEEPVDEPEYPGDDATREDLNAYAVGIGMNPDEFKNKADLVAAIHQV